MGNIISHNGSCCSEFVADNFCTILKKNIQKSFNYFSQQANKMIAILSIALQETFKDLDKLIMDNLQDKAINTGSTAIVVVIYGNVTVCASLGDSQAFVSQTNKVVALSQPITPVN